MNSFLDSSNHSSISESGDFSCRAKFDISSPQIVRLPIICRTSLLTPAIFISHHHQQLVNTLCASNVTFLSHFTFYHSIIAAALSLRSAVVELSSHFHRQLRFHCSAQNRFCQWLMNVKANRAKSLRNEMCLYVCMYVCVCWWHLFLQV